MNTKEEVREIEWQMGWDGCFPINECAFYYPFIAIRKRLSGAQCAWDWVKAVCENSVQPIYGDFANSLD